MKYLFHIHSNINLLTAIGIIEKQSLDKESIVFFMNRGVKTDFEVKTIEIPEHIYYHPFNTIKELKSFKFFKNRSIIRQIDDIIEESSKGDDFVYFCPNSRVPIYRAFFSHRRCKEVNYIEDGMDAYLSKKELETKYPQRVPKHLLFLDAVFGIFPWFCSKRLKYVNTDFMGSLKDRKSVIYCINEKAYTNQTNTNKIILDVGEISFFRDLSLDNDYIFVFDAVVEQKVIEKEDLNTFVEWFSGTYFKGDNIAIKFHPFQSEDSQQEIVGIFNKNNVEVEVISNKIIMEIIFAKRKELSIYGIGSSLLVYAAMFNDHNVEVLFPYFENYIGVISPRLSTWNAMFLKSKNVELLQMEN